jgi:hypothetical protein
MGDLLRAYRPDELRRDGYPLTWRTINAVVCNEAGHRCVRCGHPYRKGRHGKGEWSPCDDLCTHGGPIRSAVPELVAAGVEAQWRILTVHHLNGAKADCRWWNLAALCQRCHLTIQGRVKLAQVYVFEHSTWFRPYAAGYYAWSYLGEELTREETVARLDELLALERVS